MPILANITTTNAANTRASVQAQLMLLTANKTYYLTKLKDYLATADEIDKEK